MTEEEESKSNAGAIAGGVTAGVVGIIIIGSAVLFCCIIGLVIVIIGITTGAITIAGSVKANGVVKLKKKQNIPNSTFNP